MPSRGRADPRRGISVVRAGGGAPAQVKKGWQVQVGLMWQAGQKTPGKGRPMRPTGCVLLALLMAGSIAPAAGAESNLLEAARQGDLTAVRARLTQGADVHAADVDGTTPLHWAAYR